MSVEQKAWNRIENFLNTDTFNGFTSDDLFIMNFIKKGWGQDIAALSNMAEAVLIRHNSGQLESSDAQRLLREIKNRATHKTVSPYRQNIETVNDLGKHGYYLEHLNIILGVASTLGLSDYTNLNLRISEHLREQSLGQKNAHAPLMPNIKMRWAADQAAILKSLWLCDKNHNTNFHKEPVDRWLNHMKTNMTHSETGLFETEAMRVKKYSKQPRGCSMAYMIHYTSSFAPDIASEQWNLFKEHMCEKQWGLTSFREYLPTYEGKWTPDTGPIIGGIGVAATGLALKAAKSVGDLEMHQALKGSVDTALSMMHGTDFIPGLNILTSIGTDVLASAIYLNSCCESGSVR